MSTSTLKQPIPVIITKAIAANTSASFALGNYECALLVVGNPNRTAAQSAVYALTRSADPIELKASAYVSITTDTSGNVTVTASVNTGAFALVFK